MAVGKCEQCGVDEYMPFVCKFCRGRFCAAHRLPENHGCKGLDVYRERVRSEGRLVAPEPDVVTPKMSPGARMSAGLGSLFDRLEGKAAFAFLATMVGVFLLSAVMGAVGLVGLRDFLFVLDSQFYFKPWTIVTSVFTHFSFNHFFFNGLILFFFGPTLERLIGTRRFSYLFIGGGAVAGLLQLLVFNYALPVLAPGLLGFTVSGIIGASGGLLALLGALTVLAPRLTVLVMFVIPAPLWAITALYALVDVLGLLSPGSGVAHLAHLGGLAIGLAYGKHLHDQGVRARVERPTSMHRRYF